ncbi:cutinase family protein [Mycobacterium sp. 1423905.2]|uniref:cutinase family protein n=1 Tax=Mycobacterium sp. 1423905.2 TaxID=1856859 RepID=UPI0007FE4009|nr:cutinase family protein [Mycobacterium sp. 1423905.2]OBJ54809.1 cutinase [Mycobacterium sp. 1423905.2]
MISRHVVRFLVPAAFAAAGLGSLALFDSALPSASASPCPDVEVLFARGTGEAPGVGATGQAFVDDLRPRLGDRSMDVYPVNYPASDQWGTGVEGVRDAGAHVLSTAQNCPQTHMVLSGYSQGAAVMGFVTSAAVPEGVDPASVPRPLDPQMADHVSSVVLFGTPNPRAMEFLGQPPLAIGPLYQSKTLKVCETGDPVCSDGLNFAAHNTYADDRSMIDEGAAFAAGSVGGNPAGAPSPAQLAGFGE